MFRYPGGLWFDPLGWGSGSPEKIKELRTKEIKNGRLAMLAVMGAWFQAEYTGTGPIDNLFAHLADPGHAGEGGFADLRCLEEYPPRGARLPPPEHRRRCPCGCLSPRPNHCCSRPSLHRSRPGRLRRS